ncbi:MAG: LysR family transcriptional regulator [Ilumatobacteraceae bacterium]
MLDRPHYQLLLELSRAGTVSEAADRLYITQSAASQRLQQAERRFGFPLTVRVGRRLALTPAAQRLVEAADESERALLAGEVDARWLSTAGEAALLLAIDVFDHTPWLTPAIIDVGDDPDTAGLEVVRAPAGDAHRLLIDRRADVSLQAGPTTGTLATRELFDDQLVGVVGPANPLGDRRTLTPDDFAGADYVTYSTVPRAGFEQATFLGPANAVPQRILRLESVTAIASLIATTTWCSILPSWMVDTRSGVVAIPLEPAPPPIVWSLVQRDLTDEARRAQAADQLVDFLRR